jgi:DNA repair photolyase
VQAIYEPKGRALEYAPLACNLYRGCGHGCTYCYAPATIRMNRDEFHGNPQPRLGILEALEKDAKKLAGDPRPVLLSFTCDPYQPINDQYGLTRQAIHILNRNNLAVHILTKRGKLAAHDFDLLERNPLNAFGTTLTWTSPTTSREWEPGASLPEERWEALRLAHKRHIPTWVSLEPALSPRAAIMNIRITRDYVDLYKIGKWNYDARAKEIDWPAFREEVTALLDRLGKKYLIKRDLREA